MSMQYYAIDDYGLVFSENDMKYLVSHYCDDYDEEEFKRFPYDYYDCIVDMLGLICNADFNGEITPINDDGFDEWNLSRPLTDETIYYLTFMKYPRLLSAVYNSIDEVVEEMKKKLSKYLPADFDYRGKLYHIVGTIFG